MIAYNEIYWKACATVVVNISYTSTDANIFITTAYFHGFVHIEWVKHSMWTSGLNGIFSLCTNSHLTFSLKRWYNVSYTISEKS